MDKLTIVEGEERLKTEIDFLDGQLKDALRDNERLRGAALSLLMGCTPHGADHTILQNLRIKWLAEALQPNKDSDNG